MHYIIEVDGYLFSWHCHTFEHNIAGLFIEKEKLFENKFENLEKIILKEFPEIKLHRYNRNRDI